MLPTPSGRRASILSLALLLGCPSAEPEPEPEPTPAPSVDWCDDGRAGSIAHGRRDAPIGVFPNDHFVLPNPGSRTGVGVHVEYEQNAALLAHYPPEWGFYFDEISVLDGWGLTAGIVFRFEFALDPSAITDEQVVLVAFEDDGPRTYTADVEVTEFPDTIIARPRLPLPPATQVAAVVLQGPLSSDGTCVRPHEHLRELLSPTTDLPPGVPAHVLSPRYVAAVDALGLEVTDVAHMTVFTTQSTPLDSLVVLDDVSATQYPLDAPMVCGPDGGDRVDCEGTITVKDYRGSDFIVAADFDGSAPGSYALPVSITFPGPIDDGPWPVVFIGHGMGGGRNNQGGATEQLTSLGLAVVATDAIQHGDHPTRTSQGGAGDADIITSLLDFLAVEGQPSPRILPRVLRDNFRQSAWDRLQIIEAVRQGIDADGDGDTDLDSSRMLYFGASLGGMMGTETMALAPDLQGGMLGITGGRISQIVSGNEQFAGMLDLLIPDGYGDDDIKRVLPIAQAVVDGGDPMVWARYLVGERLVGDAQDPPQLLVQYAYQDEVVPNITNRNHAHALQVPLIGRELFPLEELETLAGPLEGNLPNGRTAGVMVLDYGRPLNNPGAEPELLGHVDSLLSYEASLVWRPFLTDTLEGETGVIFDPYLED